MYFIIGLVKTAVSYNAQTVLPVSIVPLIEQCTLILPHHDFAITYLATFSIVQNYNAEFDRYFECYDRTYTHLRT